jgi:hypothetical protein
VPADLPGAAGGVRSWQVALLLPQPPLSILYLLLIRAERVPPRFAPVVVLAVLPLASLVVGIRRWVRSHPPRGRRELALLAVSLLELAWAVLSAAVVGFAIALQSG